MLKRPLKMTNRSYLCLLALSLMVPASANAHVGHHIGGWMAGFAHPFFGMDHLLALLAVGFVAGQYDKVTSVRTLLAFIAFMIGGAGLAMAGVAMPFAELGIGLSSVVVGGLLMLATFSVSRVVVPLLALFALCHGFAHGNEITTGANPLAYVLGFSVATLVIQGSALVFAKGAAHSAVRSTTLRVYGGLTALVGVVLTGTNLAVL